jgi:hypothetical protein
MPANSFLVIIVCLRTYTRAIILHNAGNDDYAMIAALIVTIGYLATLFVLRDNKMGFRGKEASFPQAVTTLQVAYAVEIIYYLCVNIIKVSIVLFYLRFGKHPIRLLLHTILTLQYSGQETFRASLQRHDISSHDILFDLHHCHPCAVSTTL